MAPGNEGEHEVNSPGPDDAGGRSVDSPTGWMNVHPETTASFPDELAKALHLLDGDVTSEEQEAIAALPSGSALLVVRRGPDMGARFLLDTDVTLAGRHPEADVFLDDVTVSRRHAEFRRAGTRFEVRDLDSLNGTYVDGVRIDAPAPLRDRTEVQVGKFKLTFYASRQDLVPGGTSS